MKVLTLRLTDEEHEQLASWALEGHRSLQKEIIYRLFSVEHFPRQGGVGRRIDVGAGMVSEEISEPASSLPHETPAPSESGAGTTPVREARPRDHFKPDFKTGKRK